MHEGRNHPIIRYNEVIETKNNSDSTLTCLP